MARHNANTIVDLDGVAKGFVVDMLVDALLCRGKDFYVDWAGDIRAEGSHPSGRPWRSAVRVAQVEGHYSSCTLGHGSKGDNGDDRYAFAKHGTCTAQSERTALLAGTS